MAKQFKVLVNSGKDQEVQTFNAEQGAGQRGRALEIKAQAGAKYQLVEVGKGKNLAPDNIKAKRVGKNLHLMFEADEQADVVIEDYYAVTADKYNAVVGLAENGRFYEYITEDPTDPGFIALLSDNTRAVTQALGGLEVSAYGAAIGVVGMPWLGALGLLGVEAAALYAADKGTAATNPTGGDLASASDSGSTNTDNLTKENKNLVINGKGAPNSTVDVLVKNESGQIVYQGKATTDANGNYTYTVPGTLPDGKYTPYTNGLPGEPFVIDTVTQVDIANAGKAGTTDTISGTAEPGDSIKVYDAAGTLIGTTTADANGNWSIKPVTPLVPGEIRADATDPAGNQASDTANNNAGNTTPASSQKTALTIDPISTDNVLALSEQGASSYTVTGKVTGAFAAGDVVTLSLNGKTYAAVVGANGSYSVAVPMSDMLADPDTKLEGKLSGSGGDTATAAQDYTLEASNTATKTALSINPVTADNILSASENTGALAITGKVTGKFAAGDTVTLLVNGKTFTGRAAADGSYSINVPASDLAADSDTQVDGSVTGTGGTQASAIQNYGLDNGNATPPANPDPNNPANIGSKTAIAIDPVTGDNLLAASESGSINVSGKVSGTFAAGDTVTLYVNGKTYSGTAAANGSYTIAVPAADLLADKDTKIEADVTGTGGDKATAAQDYTIEANPNAPAQTALAIDPVTADNFISSSESTGTINITGKVTGKYVAGDVVTLTVGGKAYTGVAAANGSFSIAVPAGDVVADSDSTVDGVVSGTGGTLATAKQNYGLDNGNATPPANPDPNNPANIGSKTAIAIDPVTGDNLLAASESGSINVSGKVSGTFAAGDTVTLYVNGKTYSGTAAANGSYTIAVPAADLLADKDTKIEADVTGTGGDKATAAQDYTIETNPNAPAQTALAIDPVTADNFISSSESTGTINITGKVTGKYVAGDVVTC